MTRWKQTLHTPTRPTGPLSTVPPTTYEHGTPDNVISTEEGRALQGQAARIGHACLRWAYKCCSPFHFTSRWCPGLLKYQLPLEYPVHSTCPLTGQSTRRRRRNGLASMPPRQLELWLGYRACRLLSRACDECDSTSTQLPACIMIASHHDRH